MTFIIQAENLSRFYGLILGLNNVSFGIRPGITGVVGPNGSGKTTLFRLILGQIRPSAGIIRVFGKVPWNNPGASAQIAYCPEGEHVPGGTSALEWLLGLGMISGLSARDASARSRRALDRVRLTPEHWKKNIGTFSKGMKQRTKLAQCLLHDPRLVILDEPMNGLDPMGREDFANVLRELSGQGVSVVISSHILHDLEALCAEFLLLRWGRIPRAANDAASGANRKAWPEATTFRCASPENLARYFFERRLVRGCEIASETGILNVRWQDPAQFYEQFERLLLESGVAIYEVRATESSLEKAVEHRSSS